MYGQGFSYLTILQSDTGGRDDWTECGDVHFNKTTGELVAFTDRIGVFTVAVWTDTILPVEGGSGTDSRTKEEELIVLIAAASAGLLVLCLCVCLCCRRRKRSGLAAGSNTSNALHARSTPSASSDAMNQSDYASTV